jgi:hypothetical protein
MRGVGTQRESAEIFDGPPDNASLAPRTWATGPEVYELGRRDSLARGKTPYRNLLNHQCDLYDVLRRRVAQSGADRGEQHIISSHQCVRDLYDAPEGGWTMEALQSRAESPRRWMKALARMGLVEYETATDEVGLWVGWRFRLLEVPLASPAPAGVAQSVQASGSCEARRRRESAAQREERRVRPNCRRSGQKGVWRYVDGPVPDEPPPRVPFFSGPRFAASGASTPPGPKGPLGGSKHQRKMYGHASRERPPGLGDLSDTIGPQPCPDPVAALRDRRALFDANRGPGTAPSPNRGTSQWAAIAAFVAAGGPVRERGLGRLAELVSAGELRLDLAAAAAWWGLWGCPPRLSARAQAELYRAAAMLERLGAAGWAPEGQDVAAWLLFADMVDYAEDHAAGAAHADAVPGSLGYFVRRLRGIARRERRAWRQRNGRRQAAGSTAL